MKIHTPMIHPGDGRFRATRLGEIDSGIMPADVAVLRIETGKFGFVDQSGGRFDGSERLLCEMTLRDGAVVYDLNGMEADRWDAPPDPNAKLASKWTTFAPRGPDMHGTKPPAPSEEQPH